MESRVGSSAGNGGEQPQHGPCSLPLQYLYSGHCDHFCDGQKAAQRCLMNMGLETIKENVRVDLQLLCSHCRDPTL